MTPELIASLVDPSLMTAIAGGLLGGGFIGGIAVWRKSGPEADQIVAKTLIEVNEFLRKELALRDEEIEKLRKRLKDLRKDFNALEDEFHKVIEKRLNSPPPAPEN
jgi:hypothetical protein